MATGGCTRGKSISFDTRGNNFSIRRKQFSERVCEIILLVPIIAICLEAFCIIGHGPSELLEKDKMPFKESRIFGDEIETEFF